MTPAELIHDARDAAGYSQAELARRAGTSQPAVARYEAGAVSPSVKTLDRLLRACGQTLVLSAVEAPAADMSGRLARLVRERRAEIRALARSHGAWNVRIFGSVARGEDTAESDIDLLVDLEPDRTLFDLAGLEADLIEMLGVEVDVATERLFKPHVRETALREAVPL